MGEFSHVVEISSFCGCPMVIPCISDLLINPHLGVVESDSDARPPPKLVEGASVAIWGWVGLSSLKSSK